MTSQRIEALEGLGFKWKLFFSREDMLIQLVEYKKRVGNANVPSNFEGYQQLGQWARRQETITSSS